MRTDEEGNSCPETLGEYLRFCKLIAPESEAVKFLENKIAKQGENEKVLANDQQMRAILYPLLTKKAK